MSYNPTGITISTVQFEVWQDCNNNCKFCYLNSGRCNTNNQQKIDNINKVISYITNPVEMSSFNGVGLIGGEFFQGQLHNPDVKNTWLTLMSTLSELMDNDKIMEVWITATLMIKDLTDLYDSLDKFHFDNFKEGQRVLLCTSYDTEGRFHSEDQRKQWFENVKTIKEKYPNVYLHCSIITSNAFVKDVVYNNWDFNNIDQYCSTDYKVPTSFKFDIFGIRKENDYWEHVRDVSSKEIDNFFIENRNDFLKFLKLFAQHYGYEKLKIFSGNEFHSQKLISFAGERFSEDDRWNGENDVICSKCGHRYDGYCYLDSCKCAYCDAQELYNMYVEGEE